LGSVHSFFSFSGVAFATILFVSRDGPFPFGRVPMMVFFRVAFKPPPCVIVFFRLTILYFLFFFFWSCFSPFSRFPLSGQILPPPPLSRESFVFLFQAWLSHVPFIAIRVFPFFFQVFTRVNPLRIVLSSIFVPGPCSSVLSFYAPHFFFFFPMRSLYFLIRCSRLC